MFQNQLIEECKRNDRGAQLRLYRKYSQGMFVVAMRYVAQKENAEDMVQEGFINAFQKIDQYRGDVTFGAWLKKIVIHKCLDFIKAQRENQTALEDKHLKIVEDDNWEIEESISLEQVKQGIETLDEKYKIVVLLYLFEGYDHQEIAEILGISEVSSRTRLMRGKQKLKLILNQLYHGTGS